MTDRPGDHRAAYAAADRVIREFAPAWLALAMLAEIARTLRTLPPIVDAASLAAARPAIATAQHRAAVLARRVPPGSEFDRAAAEDAPGDCGLDEVSSAATAGLEAAGDAEGVATVAAAVKAIELAISVAARIGAPFGPTLEALRFGPRTGS